MTTFIDFAEIKQHVSIEQVVAWLNLSLDTAGNQLRGCCPIHKGTDKRDFVITPAKGLFYCFKCKEGGDLIKLYAAVAQTDQKAAAMEISQKAGLSDSANTEGDREEESLPTSSDSDQSQTKPFQPLTYLLPEHESVQGLGIAVDTAKLFGVGYAPKGVLRGRVAIPLHDREGTLLGYAGRSTELSETALSFAKGFDPDPILFNAHRCTPDSIIDLRNDLLDVLLAFQHGIEGNVVTFLTERITARQVGALALFLDDTRCCL